MLLNMTDNIRWRHEHTWILHESKWVIWDILLYFQYEAIACLSSCLFISSFKPSQTWLLFTFRSPPPAGFPASVETFVQIICLKGAGRLRGGLVTRLCLFKPWKRTLFSEPPPPSLCLFSSSHACLNRGRRTTHPASCKLAGWFPSLGLNRGSCGSLPSPKHEASVTEGDSKRFSQCCYRQALPKCPVHGLFSSSSSRSVNHRHEKHNKDTDVDLSSFQSFISLFISVLLD